MCGVLITVAILLGTGTLVVRGLTNSRLRAYGDIRKARAPRTNSMVTNAIRGILEVITFRAEEPLKDEYLKTTKLLFRISSNSSVLRTVPAKTYEVLAVLGISGAIVISILQGTGDEEYFELLSLMTLSAYRIMPTMSRVNGAIMGMRQDLYDLEAMEKGQEGLLSDQGAVSWRPLNLGHPPSIELKSITARYQVSPHPVLEDMTHRFDAQKIHAVVGPSGSGKTVLLQNLILNVYKRCFERIYVFSPSIMVDATWETVKEYIEEDLDAHETEEEKFYFDHYNPEALENIISTQNKVIKHMKAKTVMRKFMMRSFPRNFSLATGVSMLRK